MARMAVRSSLLTQVTDRIGHSLPDAGDRLPDSLLPSPRRRRNRRISPTGGKHHTPGSRTVGITFDGMAGWVCSLNRGGGEVILWEGGFRQAGGSESAVGKPLSAGADGPEKRRCSSSGLWVNAHGRFRHRAVGSH